MSKKDSAIKRLGDAELEIMQVLWDAAQPVTAKHILQQIKGKRNWALPSVMTSLARLADKGFAACDRSTGTNMYTASIAEEVYRAQESRSFLEKLYGNSFQSLVATLYNSKVIGDSDIDEVRQYLDELQKDRDGE